MAEPDVMARLRLLEDKHALRSLIGTYQRCADAWDYDGLTGCFAEDGIMENPLGRIEGRSEIKRRLSAATEKSKVKFHMIANLDFRVDGDTASGHGSLHYASIFDPERPWLLDEDGMPTGGANGGGHYDWSFVRLAEGWRISHLKLAVAWQGSRHVPHAKDG